MKGRESWAVETLGDERHHISFCGMWFSKLLQLSLHQIFRTLLLSSLQILFVAAHELDDYPSKVPADSMVSASVLSHSKLKMLWILLAPFPGHIPHLCEAVIERVWVLSCFLSPPVIRAHFEIRSYLHHTLSI